jgi:hypothetical protein
MICRPGLYVCQAERAARRASVMQMATINTVFAVGLANMGVTLSTAQGITAVSNSSFVGAGKQAPSLMHLSVYSLRPHNILNPRDL